MLFIYISLYSIWSDDPSENLAVSSMAGKQSLTKIVNSDVSYYISWFDSLNSFYHLKMQRLSYSGNYYWGTYSSYVSDTPTYMNNQNNYDIELDYSDNVIFAAQDVRSNIQNIYGFKKRPSGSNAWSINGAVLSNSDDVDTNPVVAVNEQNNSVFAWERYDAQTELSYIVMQKLDYYGDIIWNDIVIVQSSESNSYNSPKLVALEDEYFILIWCEQSSNAGEVYRNIYTQKFDGDGNAIWNENLPIYTLNNVLENDTPQIIEDNNGHIIIAWLCGSPNNELRLQCFDEDGNLSMPQDGVEVSLSVNNKTDYSIGFLNDDSNIFFSWIEENSLQSEKAIFSQKITLTGQRLWGDNAIEVINFSTELKSSSIIKSAEQDVVIFYLDYSFGNNDENVIKAIRIDQNGNPVWSEQSLLSTVQSRKQDLAVSEYSGGQFVAVWSDNRNDYADIYCQNINLDGSLGCSAGGGIINIPGDYPTIQEGIEVASAGDTVLVASGIYYEQLNYLGKNITVSSHFITTQDTSYISSTILNGNQMGRVVTFENCEDTTAVLCGFTITNGIGGIEISEDFTSPTLHNLKIINNNAQDSCGGGIYIDSASLRLRDSIVQNNYANFGGGFYIDGSDAQISNVQIIGNVAIGWASEGGGLNGQMCANIILTNCVFKNNMAYANGEAIYFYNADITAYNCLFYNNLTMDRTSIFAMLGCYLKFINCTFYEPSNIIGEIFQCYNCVIIYFVNSIFDVPEIVEFRLSSGTSQSFLHVAYSNFMPEDQIYLIDGAELIYYGDCLCENPEFIDPDNNDFHLQNTSPCIGAGIDEIEIGYLLFQSPSYDLDLLMRPNPEGSSPDLGCFENPFGEPQVVSDECILNHEDCRLTNYPNPFNPSTTISFDLTTTEAENAKIEIYNLKGQKVKTFHINPSTDQAINSITWNGNDEYGKSVSSGIYYYKLKVNGKIEAVKKCLLLK
jgi:hypothetical protein